jgi:pimeloyl-ACP methyl ester carboxylesterase
MTIASRYDTPAAAQLLLRPGAEHASNLTHPDAVNPAIEAFLASRQP